MSARDTVVPLLELDGTADCPLSGRDFLCFWPGRICSIIRFDEVYSALTQYNNRQFLSGPVQYTYWTGPDFLFFINFWGGYSCLFSTGRRSTYPPLFNFRAEHKKVTLRGVPVVVLPFYFSGMAVHGYLYGEETNAIPTNFGGMRSQHLYGEACSLSSRRNFSDRDTKSNPLRGGQWLSPCPGKISQLHIWMWMAKAKNRSRHLSADIKTEK